MTEKAVTPYLSLRKTSLEEQIESDVFSACSCHSAPRGGGDSCPASDSDPATPVRQRVYWTGHRDLHCSPRCGFSSFPDGPRVLTVTRTFSAVLEALTPEIAIPSFLATRRGIVSIGSALVSLGLTAFIGYLDSWDHATWDFLGLFFTICGTFLALTIYLVASSDEEDAAPAAERTAASAGPEPRLSMSSSELRVQLARHQDHLRALQHAHPDVRESDLVYVGVDPRLHSAWDRSRVVVLRSADEYIVRRGALGRWHVS